MVKRNRVILISPHLYDLAKAHAQCESRGVSEQIQYWATVGKASLDNPDLPIYFVRDLLLALKEDKFLVKSL